MKPVAWKLACRVLADALLGQADHAESLTSESTARRRPTVAAAIQAAESKAAGRRVRAETARRQAQILISWSRRTDASLHPAVRADLLIALVLLSYGDQSHAPTLQFAIGPLYTVGAGLPTDYPTLLERISRADPLIAIEE